MEIRNYGFDPDDVEILEEEWKFGARSERIILQRDGQWRNMPKFEHQAKGFETFGCTIYGGTSQMEAYTMRVFGFEPNHADRFNYNIAGINPPGANPQKAYESFRKQGVIDEAVLPRSATLEEYTTPRPMTDKYLEIGQEWLDKWKFSHEWIASRSASKMRAKILDNFRYCPPCLSVTAWYKENGVYVDRSVRNTHWVVGEGFKVLDKLGVWVNFDLKYFEWEYALEQARLWRIRFKIFDSYDGFRKVLHEDHVISFAKRITIKKRELLERERWAKSSFWAKPFLMLKRLWQ